MTVTAMTAEFASRLGALTPDARRRRRYSEKFRRQRGADRPMTRHSDTVAIESPGQTLEAVLTSAWEDLAVGRRAECPVCGGHMQATGADSGGAGYCGDCGSTLS